MRQQRKLGRSLVGASLITVTLAVLVPGVAGVAGAAGCADLHVTAFSISPVQPIAGQPATASITVRNSGSCAAPAFVVRSRPSLFAPSGPSTTVAGLAAATSTTVNLAHTFASAGNYSILAEVDTGGAVAETNESNNLQFLAVTVVAATRDLRITSFTVSPTRPVRGQVATATIVVKNEGNSAAGPFPVRWSPWWLASPLSSQVATLAPGASTTVNLDYVFTADGTFDTTATVDAANAVAETNESNNGATRQLVVEPSLPDLVVDSVAVSPATPLSGQPTTVTITVRNQGNSPAGAFAVQWTPWFLAAPLSAPVAGLGAGATTAVNLSYTYPFSAAFDSTVVVDPANAVAELVENNNSKGVQVVVAPSTVDLVVTNLVANPNPTTQGVLTTFTATVQNQGNTASAATVLEFNLDSTGLVAPPLAPLTAPVPALAPGQSTNVVFTFTYQKFGTFRTIATVDPANAVTETNETNNRRILDLVVNPGVVDLVIDSFSIAMDCTGSVGACDPNEIVRASRAVATITVRNAGNYPAGLFHVQWKVQSTDNGGPTAIVNGLAPGASTTVMIEFAFPKEGTVTSVATVDVWNQVFESGGGENNNVVTRSVDVQPRVYELRVGVTLNVIDAKTDGLDGNGEWDPILFAVLEPGSSCTIFGTPVADISCIQTSRDAVENGHTINVGTIDVTLEEFLPLVAAVGAVEFDDVVGIPTGADFLGLAALISFLPEYLTLGSRTVVGAGGACGGGRCFDAVFTVQVLRAPPPFWTPPAALASSLTASQQATLDKIESTLRANAPGGGEDD